jgi:hypothetical protein
MFFSDAVVYLYIFLGEVSFQASCLILIGYGGVVAEL